MAHDFEEFYRAKYPRLAGSLRLVANGDEDLAQDRAQEAFARALNHWDRLQHYDKPEGWLYRTAFNLLRHHWRERKMQPLPADIVVDAHEGDRVDLVRALSVLSAEQREAVVLRYVLDHPSKEVASMLGVSDGSLRMTLHRSLKTLRERAGLHLDEGIER